MYELEIRRKVYCLSQYELENIAYYYGFCGDVKQATRDVLEAFVINCMMKEV